MATQMLIRIDPKMKDNLSRLARMEGKTISQMVRDLIQEYITERDIGAYIDDLWNRIGVKLRSKGVGQTDVNRAIKEVRKKHR